MEALFTYFIKVNGLLITFFLAYYFLLRKETFFNKNRWFLLLGLFASVLLPLITFTKTIWVEPSPVVYETFSNDFVPYIIENKVIEEPIDWNSILFYVYLGISVVFIVKILIEILSFFRIIKFGKRTKTSEAILIDNESNENPFSFFNHIVFNSQMFSEDELQHIISHENIHVKEKHSIDVLVSKVFCAIIWVNPIMWFYQKEMLQNLEYIADAKASVIALDKINYQKTLLKVVTNQHQLSITNQFYQSLIKKRIVMLNTNQSNQRKSWKYALILPVLSAFMLLFQVETVAQVKNEKSKKVTLNKIKADTLLWVNEFAEEYNSLMNSTLSILTKNETDKELKELEKKYSDENQKLKIQNVKRNKKGEIIEIKLSLDSGETYNRVLELISENPINNIIVFFKKDNNNKLIVDFKESHSNATKAEEIIEDYNPKYKYLSLDNLSKDGKEIVLIINGKIKSAEEKIKLLYDEELGLKKEISGSEFEKKFNRKADKSKLYYEVETVKLKSVGVNWNEAKKTHENKEDQKNILYIINGKEYLQSEIPKGTTVEVDGSISELSKEEGIKKYGQKAKDGVLIFNGKSTFVKKEENEVPKNLKINFEKGKTYIIEGHKATYDELKDKNLFIYTGSKYSITEKNNVVTITGDIIEDAAMWNDIEITVRNSEKVDEAKYLTFDSGDKIVYYNETLKIPGEPAISVKDYKISINDTEISTKDFLNLIDMKFNRFVYFEKSKILKFYTNPLPNNKTFTLSNGYQVIVMENKRIKIPEYPTTILNKVDLYFNDKKISESEFIKMNYNDIKSIKVNKVEGTSGKDLRVKEIYFYSK